MISRGSVTQGSAWSRGVRTGTTRGTRAGLRPVERGGYEVPGSCACPRPPPPHRPARKYLPRLVRVPPTQRVPPGAPRPPPPACSAPGGTAPSEGQARHNSTCKPPFLSWLPPGPHTHLLLPKPRLLRPEPPLCPQLQESRWSRRGTVGRGDGRPRARGRPQPARHEAAGERSKGGICPTSQMAEGRQKRGQRNRKGREKEKEVRGRGSNALGKGKDPQGAFWEEAERCAMESSLSSTKPSVEARWFFGALGIAIVFLVVGLDDNKPRPALR